VKLTVKKLRDIIREVTDRRRKTELDKIKAEIIDLVKDDPKAQKHVAKALKLVRKAKNDIANGKDIATIEENLRRNILQEKYDPLDFKKYGQGKSIEDLLGYEADTDTEMTDGEKNKLWMKGMGLDDPDEIEKRKLEIEKDRLEKEKLELERIEAEQLQKDISIAHPRNMKKSEWKRQLVLQVFNDLESLNNDAYNFIKFLESISSGDYESEKSGKNFIIFGEKDAKKESVRLLQEFLNGFLNMDLDTDGIVGNETYNAIKNLQQKVGFKSKKHQDGAFGKYTVYALVNTLSDKTKFVDEDINDETNFAVSGLRDAFADKIIYDIDDIKTNIQYEYRTDDRKIYFKIPGMNNIWYELENEILKQGIAEKLNVAIEANEDITAKEELTPDIEKEVGKSTHDDEILKKYKQTSDDKSLRALGKAIEAAGLANVRSYARSADHQAYVSWAHVFAKDALMRKFDPSIPPGSYYSRSLHKKAKQADPYHVSKLKAAAKQVGVSLGKKANTGVYGWHRGMPGNGIKDVVDIYDESLQYIQTLGKKPVGRDMKKATRKYWEATNPYWQAYKDEMTRIGSKTSHMTAGAMDLDYSAYNNKDKIEAISSNHGFKLKSFGDEGDHYHVVFEPINENRKILNEFLKLLNMKRI
jgi:hypothetical protein